MEAARAPDASVQASSAAFATRRILLVGLGQQADWSVERGRQIGAVIGKKVRDLKLASCSLKFLGTPALDQSTTIRAVFEGLLMSSYRFDQYQTLNKQEEQPVSLETITLFVEQQDQVDPVQTALAATQALVRGIDLARDLGNHPAAVVTPSYLAEQAQELANRYAMTCTIFDHATQAELGMGGMLAVSRGSHEPAKFIILEYGMAEADRPTIVLVGKGITFDSGGLSIKGAADMDKMKMDMQGASAVLGTMEALGQLKLPLHVVALVAAAENMPSGNAYRPGDIITALNGVTIEVINTDAEGRLVLADALAYAQRYNPDAVIDLATLTGGCVVALGHYAAGAVTNNGALLQRLQQAAEDSGERIWELPLWDEYKKQIRSDIADIKNSGGRYGSAITAGAFLSFFVDDMPWVHLDIAGVAWTESQAKEYHPKGATGYGVRLLTSLLANWSESV